MAKNIQEAEVVVTLNGQAAKNTINQMTQEYNRLRRSALEAYKAGQDALGKKLDAQAQKLMKDIQVTRVETKKFADILKNVNGASLKELRGAAKQLQSEIAKLKPGTQEFITKTKQLKEVNTRINQLTASFKGLVAEEKAATLSINTLAQSFNKYFTMITAGIAAITGVSMAFRKCAQDAAAMDDAYATVMKTTGLTHEEVEQLNAAFKKMDTRTAREELNRMAYEAGKLGFTGVENIQQFVEAADIINVALGDVLGEGATLEIAKLAQVFSKSTEALDNLDLKGRMLAVGSAVNQLGKDSTASESYMVEFLGRLGGVAVQAGLSADQILGFASALDQTKQKVEMSATAFQKLIQQMIKKPEEFLEAAQMPLEEFKELMATDMNGAILKVLHGFQDMGGFLEQVPMFKEMGLDGARAAGVMSSLAGNLELVARAQSVANEHIHLGTSMTREYNIMNESMQAKLEKARKRFKDICIELGEKLNPILLKSTKLTTYIIKALIEYGKELKAAVIAIITFTAVVKAGAIMQATYNVALKATTALMKTYQAIVWAVRLAFYKLIGAQEAATIAQQELNAAMSSNVFGLLATAVAMATVAIAHFIKKQREAAEAADWERKVEESATKAYAEEAATVTTLTKILESNNVSLESRRKALEELKKIVPGYHADLTEEGKLIHNNTEALTQYIAELKKTARIKARREDIESREVELMELEDQLDAARIREANAQANMTPAKYWEMENLTDYEDPVIEEFQEATRARKNLEDQISRLTTIQENAVERLGNMTKENSAALTEEQDEIAALKKEYEDLFQTIRDENRFKPGGGEDIIADKRVELAQKIQEIHNRYNNPTPEGDNPEENPITPTPTVPSGDTPYKKALDALVKAQREEENILKQSYINREIDAEAYEKAMRDINLKYLEQKVLLAKEFSEDESAATSAWLDAQISAVELANKEMDRLAKENEARLKEEQAKFEEEQKKLEELLAEGEKIRASLYPKEARAKEMQSELDRLDELHQAKILSETEYEEAVRQLRKKYADADLKEKIENVQKYCDKANSIMEQASNFVTALKEAESAKLEAQYQKDLTAAGDNAEQREQIEAEYEQKKLDLQKKYADVDMAINIAKAIASGALAAVEAFAAAGGNPVLGAVFAALIAVTTAAEVASIIAQRNAIKNMSVNNAGSSSVKTGTRTINDGYAEGGYTEDHTTLTTVGERGREWVAPHWMVQKHPVHFANLERYRKAGSHGRSGSMSTGFADGGFTAGNTSGNLASNAVNISDIELAVENAINRSLANGHIRAFLVRQDLTDMDNQTKRFKSMTNRG